MNHNTFVVTGANKGLGYETAKSLANQKAEVIMICRSVEKGEKARTQLIQQTGNTRIHLIQADLSDQQGIRTAANEIKCKWNKIDVLINNAAITTSKYGLTKDGIETQWAVNHLGPFLLTHCLLDHLLLSPFARIVNISSNMHARGKIYFENINLTDHYFVLKAYNQSKLANVLFTYELDRRLKAKGVNHIAANCLDPGANNTEIGLNHTNFFHALYWRARSKFAMDPAKGAECQVYVASAPEVEGISGKYWHKSRIVSSSPESYDLEVAAKLWKVSEAMCNIDDFFN